MLSDNTMAKAPPATTFHCPGDDISSLSKKRKKEMPAQLEAWGMRFFEPNAQPLQPFHEPARRRASEREVKNHRQ